MRRLGALLAAAVLAAGVAGCGGDEGGGEPGAGAAKTTPPASSSPSYVGLVASEVLPQEAAEQAATLKAQHDVGVGVLRQTFRWDEIEPRKDDWAFGMHDQLVEAAAKQGIEILPIIFGVRPGEEAKPKKNAKVTATTTMPPRDADTFAAYATVLVKRYGRGGSFWKERPTVPAMPMTAWQIWNEPNLKAYWGGRANEKEYTEMLQKTSAAIRAVDPEAEIVTGGLPESKLGIPMEDYVNLLAEAGAKGSFDTVAIHPYSRSVDGVIRGVETARTALDKAGMTDVKLWITEVGWADNGPPSKFTVTSERQAQYVAEVFARTAAVAEPMKLRGVVYYGWRDVRPYPGGKDFWGLHTGLMTLENEPKPSLEAFTNAAAALRSAQ
jgi:GH35 family endo-1,4-beta-xylanase